jgi:hypothetical protein
MDRFPQLDELLRRAPTAHYTIPSILAYAIGLIFFLHQALVYLDIAVLSPLEIFWNALVYLTPSLFLLDTNRRRELRDQGSTWSQTHAAKSESLRSMLGLGGRAMMQQLPVGANIVRSMTSAKSKPQSDAPPGLGNWDNSCYQNSVLQGLSAMDSLKPYLASFSSHETLPTDSTSSSLQEVVQKLNNASLNGTHIWTPAKLKSMSSWQQQDAQEYYSKIVDDLEKEASKVFGAAAVKPGLENSENKKVDISEQMAAPPFSVPLEGLLAQRVACTRCGFSEGLSMIPFNCLTVPLGSNSEYDLADCLNEYTHIEDIPEVECAKCTLLKAKTELSRMLPKPVSESDNSETDGKKVMQLPPALQEKIAERLRAVTEALAADDFSDKTIKEVCQISKRAHTSSTKTRQAVIGRAPRSLVVHINRSVFDEMTRKRIMPLSDILRCLTSENGCLGQSRLQVTQEIQSLSQILLLHRLQSQCCSTALTAMSVCIDSRLSSHTMVDMRMVTTSRIANIRRLLKHQMTLSKAMPLASPKNHSLLRTENFLGGDSATRMFRQCQTTMYSNRAESSCCSTKGKSSRSTRQLLHPRATSQKLTRWLSRLQSLAPSHS